MISSLPLTNSARFRHRLSTVYPSDTRCGSREFQLFSAPRTFRIAVSRVNGGTNLICGWGAVPPLPFSAPTAETALDDRGSIRVLLITRTEFVTCKGYPREPARSDLTYKSCQPTISRRWGRVRIEHRVARPCA